VEQGPPELEANHERRK